jgi:hypothetical protein
LASFFPRSQIVLRVREKDPKRDVVIKGTKVVRFTEIGKSREKGMCMIAGRKVVR